MVARARSLFRNEIGGGGGGIEDFKTSSRSRCHLFEITFANSRRGLLLEIGFFSRFFGSFFTLRLKLWYLQENRELAT